MFGTVEDAYNMGAVAVGATIYFGSPESGRQIVEVAQAFERAHQLGMATILWCYTRNNAFKKDGVEEISILSIGDIFYADVGTEHVAHPQGIAQRSRASIAQ